MFKVFFQQLCVQKCKWDDELDEQNKKTYDSMFNPDIQVNDICILRDSQAKRVFWKLCKVEQLVTGRDGSVRSARIAVLSNDSKKLFLKIFKAFSALRNKSNAFAW